MALKIATWNINSVRLRIGLVTRFLETWQPDILCLQETKCPQGQFPSSRRSRTSATPISPSAASPAITALPSSRAFPSRRTRIGSSAARMIAATSRRAFGGATPLIIHNLYVPAGGDEPDPKINEKFAHKLKFIDELEHWFANGAVPGGKNGIVVGDLNIAPLENDVWSHRQLLKVVSHTPVETEGLVRVQRAGNWVDVMRQHVPADQKLYTWWSYRARDWDAADRGRRLDHIWSTPDLAPRCHEDRDRCARRRGWTQPSDHVPVIATLRLKINARRRVPSRRPGRTLASSLIIASSLRAMARCTRAPNSGNSPATRRKSVAVDGRRGQQAPRRCRHAVLMARHHREFAEQARPVRHCRACGRRCARRPTFRNAVQDAERRPVPIIPCLMIAIAGRKIMVARGEGEHLQMRAFAIRKDWNPAQDFGTRPDAHAAPPGHSSN